MVNLHHGCTAFDVGSELLPEIDGLFDECCERRKINFIVITSEILEFLYMCVRIVRDKRTNCGRWSVEGGVIDDRGCCMVVVFGMVPHHIPIRR